MPAEEEQQQQDLDFDDEEESSGDETMCDPNDDNDVVIPIETIDLTHAAVVSPSRNPSLISIADAVDDYFDGLAYRIGQLDSDPLGAREAISEFARKMAAMYAQEKKRREQAADPIPISFGRRRREQQQQQRNIDKPLPATPVIELPTWENDSRRRLPTQDGTSPTVDDATSPLPLIQPPPHSPRVQQEELMLSPPHSPRVVQQQGELTLPPLHNHRVQQQQQEEQTYPRATGTHSAQRLLFRQRRALRKQRLSRLVVRIPSVRRE